MPNVVNCKHYKQHFTYKRRNHKSFKQTHRKVYAKKEEFENFGKKMNFVAINESNVTLGQLFFHLHDGKLYTTKMSQRAVHWIHIHECPFSILEEGCFNTMMKEAFL